MTGFQIDGRVLVPGEAKGLAIVTDTPLSLWGGLDPDTGVIVDRFHPLEGVMISGQILVLPTGRGSCSASGVLLEASRNGVAPLGFIVSEIDPIIGLGAVLSDELLGRPIPVVMVSAEARRQIQNGDQIEIDSDGSVSVKPSAGPA